MEKFSLEMFDNLRVLELASVLAGPSVGQFFAELGAEVIKIESSRNGGDVTRSWKGAREQTDDRSAYFCSVNWGKKSVALDLSLEADREVVWKLASKCDVVIASYKPGDAEKLGVSYQQLRKLNPQLIYGQITGYGSENDRVGYDAVLQAETGFMDLNGEKNGPPTKMPVALIDVLAAHQLKEGLLLALLKRAKTGEGSLVEVSLVQAAVSSLVNQASNWLVAKNLPTRQGSAHPNIAPYGDTFLTADGKRILLAIGSDRQFQDLCTLLDLPGAASDARFATNQRRVENRGELLAILSNEISKHAAPTLMARIHEQKIPAGLVQNVAEALAMEESRQAMLSSDGLKGIRTFVSSNASNSTILPPPHFGEHTEEVRKQLDNQAY